MLLLIAGQLTRLFSTSHQPFPLTSVRVAQLLLKILFSQENETQLRLFSRGEAALSPPPSNHIILPRLHGNPPKGIPVELRENACGTTEGEAIL